METLNRYFLILIAIAAAHAVHLNTLGTENIILGSVSNQFSYPPKWAFFWFAKNIESFEEKEGFEKPIHFAWSECIQSNPLTPNCIKLLEIIRSKTNVDLNTHSNSSYKFTLTYVAIMNCNDDAIQYLRAKGALVETKPGPGLYENVNPIQFLYGTACENKLTLKQALFDKPNGKYSGKFFNEPDWNESEFFK